MNELIRVTWDDLKFGEILPWNVYDQNNKLLLSAGHTITSKETMDNLRQYVLYRNVVDKEHGKKNKQKKINVFAELDKYTERLSHIFTDIDAARLECKEKTERLAHDVMAMCRYEPEASLAVLRLPNTYAYSAFYAMQRAIMCGMMVVREDMYQNEEVEIISAALTLNVGMHTVQDELRRQMRFPSDEQQGVIDRYLPISRAMLETAGIENSHWLNIIRDHNDVLDGSISDNDACPGSLLLAAAERYSEALDSSAYRQPTSAEQAQDRYFGDTVLADSHYAGMMIDIMTVYPPGTFVKLTNGEIAIVVHRGRQDPMLPILKSIEGPDGNRYANPLLRDCNNNDYEIESFIEYDHKDMLNYSKLWGYVK